MKTSHFKKMILCPVLLVLIMISSCRKGEDDPVFTVLSRKARLAGDWKVTQAKIIVGIKDPTGSYAGVIYHVDKSNYSLDLPGNGGHFEGPSQLSLSFTKDGMLTLKQLMDSVSFEATGTWDFQGKVGKYKNKEHVTLRLNYINGYSDRLDLFNKSINTFTYRIKELRNKKLVLVTEEEMISLYKNGAGYYVTSEYIFVQ